MFSQAATAPLRMKTRQQCTVALVRAFRRSYVQSSAEKVPRPQRTHRRLCFPTALSIMLPELRSTGKKSQKVLQRAAHQTKLINNPIH